MSNEETSRSGLLSKVVRFVRNPTVNWTELDSIDADRETQYSKQMLKEMIERKRRNDFVRRREFDQLRKLRQREALEGHRVEDPAAHHAFFQSSMTSPDERAVTIKKIDEIEAQMSQQWWKSKQNADAPSPSAFGAESTAGVAARAFAPTALLSLPAFLEEKTVVTPLFADDSMSITGFGGVDAHMQERGADEGPFRPATATVAPQPVFEFVHEPDLEEAAIRFANGDNAGAEAGLLDVLAQHQQDDSQDQLEIWMTLFDLYRATDQSERFDALAIDFAARFSRSAPLWFSMPEQLGLVPEKAGADAQTSASVRRDFNWNAPSTLTVASVAALKAALERAASPWMLTWSRITAIEEAAVPLLAEQFTQWAERKVQLVFTGGQQLQSLLEDKTPSGDKSASPQWWLLRMATLRLMGRPDEFELVALDYCVTYEVSPPSWVPPRCGYLDGEGSDAGLPAAVPGRDFLASVPGGLAVPAPFEFTPQAALSGQINGDAAPLLAPFEALMRPGVPLIIACDRLIRMDFAAAGSALNWAAEQQAQGHVLQFDKLQRLVAIFFNVIGVNEHAWVVPRKD